MDIELLLLSSLAMQYDDASIQIIVANFQVRTPKVSNIGSKVSCGKHSEVISQRRQFFSNSMSS